MSSANPFLIRATPTGLANVAKQSSNGPSAVRVSSPSRRSSRDRKQTTILVDGYAIKKLNNYDLEDGEPALTSAMLQPAKVTGKRSAYSFFSMEVSHPLCS